MGTFYIASSSDDDNIEVVRKFAKLLKDRFGLEWDHDWTVGAYGDPRSAIAYDPVAADREIKASIECDVFILFATISWSCGAHIEFGARLASGKQVHIILLERDAHFFYHHSLVTIHNSINEFLNSGI